MTFVTIISQEVWRIQKLKYNEASTLVKNDKKRTGQCAEIGKRKRRLSGGEEKKSLKGPIREKFLGVQDRSRMSMRHRHRHNMMS